MPLRCESLKPPMSQMGRSRRLSDLLHVGFTSDTGRIAALPWTDEMCHGAKPLAR
jgi:hypothetical protein